MLSFTEQVCESRRVVTQFLPQPALKFLLQTQISTTFLLHHALKRPCLKFCFYQPSVWRNFVVYSTLGWCFYTCLSKLKMSNWQTEFTNSSEMSHIQRESDIRHRKNEARMIKKCWGGGSANKTGVIPTTDDQRLTYRVHWNVKVHCCKDKVCISISTKNFPKSYKGRCVIRIVK